MHAMSSDEVAIMKRMRLSTLTLLILIAALGGTVVMQRRMIVVLAEENRTLVNKVIMLIL
jgi:hypothetical protein